MAFLWFPMYKSSIHQESRQLLVNRLYDLRNTGPEPHDGGYAKINIKVPAMIGVDLRTRSIK